MTIEEFLDSGAFVDTNEGPHFCQLGKHYRVYVHGASAEVKADYIIKKHPKSEMVFALVNSSGSTLGGRFPLSFPVGAVPIERIDDVAV